MREGKRRDERKVEKRRCDLLEGLGLTAYHN